MFYYIDGTLALIDGTVAVVDCGGVGYALNTTVNSLARVKIGEQARFYVYTLIREDCSPFTVYFPDTESGMDPSAFPAEMRCMYVTIFTH